MSHTIRTDRRANLHGSLWMIAAMAGFAVEDALLKAAAAFLPVGQLLILFGTGGALLFAGLARQRGERLSDPAVISRPMRFRLCFEIIGRLFYTLAIALAPLSMATVILQATPLVVVASAALLFGERVGWRRWIAILVGFVGVLFIVQPGGDGFSALSVLALVGMLGFAGRDLASRAAPITLGPSVLGFYGFLAVMVAGGIYALWEGAGFVPLAGPAALSLAGAVVTGVLAYTCLMKAMRTGEVSVVTPFRYTRLIFGLLLGVVVFGENLGGASYVGVCLIVLSGLFILWRQNRQGPRP